MNSLTPTLPRATPRADSGGLSLAETHTRRALFAPTEPAGPPYNESAGPGQIFSAGERRFEHNARPLPPSAPT
jgi:hypothetical protein